MFGRYRLQDLLGAGGMARVYRAELLGPAGFRKAVALKIMRADGINADRLALVREGCLVGRLNHPHIVDVYELGEKDGQPFIAMELIDGLTLSELIERTDPVPGAVVLEIGVAVAAGLAKAHAFVSEGGPVGLVHRDLKPSNILISWDGAVKIADFGIAVTRQQEEVRASDPEAFVLGTPAYMSPEQARGEVLDGRSDLFSLGLVLAETALGAHPTRGRTVRQQILAGTPVTDPLLTQVDCAAIDRSVPGLSEILIRCLQPHRDARPESAVQTLAALHRLQVAPRLYFPSWLQERARPTSATLPFPAPSTSSIPWSGTNLTEPPFELVGRDAEREALARLVLGEGRLITVKGPGGIGKTLLCQHVAWGMADRLEGGVWFVDLAEARSILSVLVAVAGVLGVPIGRAEAPRLAERLGHAICGRSPTLVVLDNFEQISGVATETVARWRELAPEATFVITSRQPLRLEGEQVLELSRLSDLSGVALFRARAAAAGASWEDSPDSSAAIARIVRELDGLPLAIELAAARADALTPAQLVGRLRQRFRLLQRRDDTTTPRQRTLRSTIDWSWNLLAPWERLAMAQLSVFRSGFFMSAAESVLALPPDGPWPLDVVGALLDRSLLRSRPVQGQPRFSMSISVRTYAAEKLRGERRVACERRHARHFSRLGTTRGIDRLFSHRGAARQRLLEVERENLIAGAGFGISLGDGEAAARCALAAGMVFERQGPFAEGFRLLRRVLDEARLPPRLQARVQVCMGRLMGYSGWSSAGRDVLEEAAALARAAGDQRIEAHALGYLGRICCGLGEVDTGIGHLLTAIRIAREARDPQREGQVAVCLANRYHEAGRIDEMAPLISRALQLSRQVGDRRVMGSLLHQRAILLCGEGRWAEARTAYEQSLQIAREIGNRQSQGFLYNSLGILACDRGYMAEGLEYYRRGLRIARELGDRENEGMLLANMGELLRLEGKSAVAASLLEQAIVCSESIWPVCAAAARASLAQIQAGRGAIKEARALLARAEPHLRGVHRRQLALLLCARANVERAAGDTAAADTALAEARTIARELGVGKDSDLGKALSALG